MRIRDVLALLVGLAVVGAIGYGAWFWLTDTVEEGSAPPPAESDPATTVNAYLDAWEQSDYTAMLQLVRDEPPEDFAARHGQLREGLEATSLSLSAGDPVSDVDGRAMFPVTVALEAEFAPEPLTWEVELNLLRERGQWGVVWSLETIHPELRASWEFATESDSVDRMDILASDGTVLSGTRRLVTFGFEPTSVDDAEEVVEAFAEALPGSEGTAERELGRNDLVDGWFYPIVTVPEAQADDAAPILRGASGILRRTEDGRGLYEQGFAQHVVGVVSEATAEQLEQLDLSSDTRIDIGQYGLERRFEDDLLGSDIVRAGLREISDEPGPLRIVFAEVQADPSRDIETTLDMHVQEAIENALVDVSGEVAIVAVDAADGAIRGSASRPLGGYNRALEGRYPPGSTFKTVTAEAGLASGLSLDSDLDCPASITLGGLQISNAGDVGRGSVDLRTAFAQSCNTTFATIGVDLGNEDLTAAAERFGFGAEWELPLSSFGGSFPQPADTAELGASAFGQARIEASVLQMATVAAAAATGEWHAPFLLSEEGPGESRSLTEGTSDALRDMMRAVVTDGTGTEANVSGAEVLGKTGTAQASGGVEHAWFIGFYDGIGFAILVEDGGAGGAVAAPIAARFVRELEAIRQGAEDGDGEGNADGEDDGDNGDGEELEEIPEAEADAQVEEAGEPEE